MKVSALAENLSGSEIIKIAGEINELKKQGQNIANLTIGDFDSNIYPIPTELKEGIIDAYNHNQTNYPPADGVLALRESVSTFLKNRMGLEYAPNHILISGGSRPLIYAAYLALVDPGDKVIFPTPSWNNNHYCDLLSAEAVLVETKPENNFMPTAEELRPHLKGATLLALCSPLNPTGTMFSKKDLEEICDLVIAENKSRGDDEKPLYLMYDQIYSQLTFGQHQHFDPVTLRPELKDYTIFIDGGSKCFAATGVRVGWGFGPSFIIDNMKAIVGHMGAWSPKAEQVAMAAYLKNEEFVDTYLDELKGNVQASLNTLHQGFQKLKAEGYSVDSVEPMGAIYLTIKIDYTGKTTPDGQVLNNSADVNFYLIKHAGVAFVPFSAFGTGHDVNWFRASVGTVTLSEVEQMMPRIGEALAKLK
ncbi:aminotransferase class I/II-fold pyridoxal phosphate-dependent enzyme [Mucilaginibacter pallidiroseus]|uniref:Aminotransferase class I/II-fold pyridoxal phosphate-dependent enzyme n=1 Tax=Mucilaginibacter pallidiroseus TaxID=2599295 RepID=A0A563UG61_9SPHI|nr:aminotransferase class I/II-fold pyridoxal phosphate-dependent enzyme [Mucilaginibacter pallidiroseus]TWR30380.1 aminotransferase class I/II-fold pyridoxal phosphate-dependent enzyme [Mucilaginibacter pallidiroseus]